MSSGRGQTPPAQARGSRHRLNRRNLVDSSPDAGCSSPTSNSSVNSHLQSSPNPPAPPVIHPTMQVLCTNWNSSEYLQKRELGKKNRSSQIGGCLHSGGYIPHSEHQKRLDSFVKLKDTSSQASTSDTDGCEQQPINENEIFLQATGGMSKKGRVYGIGSVARRLRSSSSSSSSSIGYFGSHSQNYYLQQEIEERIARMNAELRDIVDTQQQHIAEQNRKMEAMERMIASQQQMMQQYFASIGIQPQPPTDYPEDNWEARNEGKDEDDDID